MNNPTLTNLWSRIHAFYINEWKNAGKQNGIYYPVYTEKKHGKD
jgi:hypothetical protein